MLVESGSSSFSIVAKKEATALQVARGDIHAAIWGPYAFMGGGYTSVDENDHFVCKSLGTIEIFDFAMG